MHFSKDLLDFFKCSGQERKCTVGVFSQNFPKICDKKKELGGSQIGSLIWMSQEVSKWVITSLQIVYIRISYNPLTMAFDPHFLGIPSTKTTFKGSDFYHIDRGAKPWLFTTSFVSSLSYNWYHPALTVSSPPTKLAMCFPIFFTSRNKGPIDVAPSTQLYGDYTTQLYGDHNKLL